MQELTSTSTGRWRILTSTHAYTIDMDTGRFQKLPIYAGIHRLPSYLRGEYVWVDLVGIETIRVGEPFHVRFNDISHVEELKDGTVVEIIRDRGYIIT